MIDIPPNSNRANERVKVVTFSTLDPIDADRKTDFRLLAKLYEKGGLFERNFTADELVPEKNDPGNDYQSFLKNDAAGFPVTFSMLVKNFGGEDEKILAVTAGTFFKDSGVGLIPYIAKERSDHFEKVDIKPLRDAQIQSFEKMAKHYGTQLKGLVSEASLSEISEFSAKKGIMNPDKRLKIMKLFGGGIVPIDYHQPPLTTDTNAIPLVLLNYPLADGSRASAQTLGNWLKEFHVKISALDEPLKDISYSKPAEQLGGLARGEASELGEGMKETITLHGAQEGFATLYAQTKNPNWRGRVKSELSIENSGQLRY